MIIVQKECFVLIKKVLQKSTVEQRKYSMENGHPFMPKECLLNFLMEWDF